MLTFHRRVGKQHSVRIRISERSEGDAASALFMPEEQHLRTFPQQVHGSEILSVFRPGEGNGHPADGLVTSTPGAVIGVRSADCVSVALYGMTSSKPLIGVVHAGWRGIRAGVIDAAVRRFVASGSGPVRAIVGPHISTAEYEFGPDDLSEMMAIAGEGVAGRTRYGKPALDLGAAVAAMLVNSSVSIDYKVQRCTASDERYWSHRSAGDSERFALMAEIERLP